MNDKVIEKLTEVKCDDCGELAVYRAVHTFESTGEEERYFFLCEAHLKEHKEFWGIA